MAGVTLLIRALLNLLVISASSFAYAQADAAVDERLALQEALHSALEVDDFPVARVRALEIMSVTEKRFGKDSRELIIPITNVGTVALWSGDLATAETLYQRAISLAENQLSGNDLLQVRPLHGLGEVRLAQQNYTDAIALLKRAIDLSRNLDGLYNPGQIDIVDALIKGYVSLGNLTEAEREQQFLLRVAETSFGKRDIRLLEPLDRYARWFEFVGRYSTARGLHTRALQIAEQLSANTPALGVPALRGLSRTWFLEALYGPETESDPTIMNEGPSSMPQGVFVQRPSSEGERALRMAVDILERTQPDDLRTRGETLVQFGDWYLVGGNFKRMARYYSEAWKMLETAGGGARGLLEQPRLLYYKPTPMSVTRFTPSDPSAYAVHRVEMKLIVGRDGKVTDIKVTASDAPESAQRSVMTAAKRARYAPRLIEGEPAETLAVPLTETVYVKTLTPVSQN